MAVYRRILAASNSSINLMKRYYSVDDLRNQKQGNNVPDPTNEMISRRKILSKSRDDLNTDNYAIEEEEDVWYHKEKLFKDHVQEVIDKWTQIDDEIWAKVICFERNRRIAKAYARAPVLTINGSDDGFDGYRIGLLGFDNPMRDQKTEEAKKSIGHGVKIKMDDAGNILIKRVSKANVYIKDVTGPDDSSVSAEGLKLPNGALEMDKPMKLFDMRKFQQNVSKELKRAYPDRRKLEYQCVSAVAFVNNNSDVLECPVWVMIVNIVAMDMLKSKLPPVQRPRNRIKLPDEDPYSVPGSGSSSSSRERRADRPPKLPPRDTGMTRYPIPKPDYEELQLQQLQQQQQQQQHADENKYRIPHLQSSRKKATNFPDDPYYCGMKAHTPNFAANKSKTGTLQPGPPSASVVESPYAKTWMMAGPYPGLHQGPPAPSAPNHHHHHHQPPPPQQKMQPPTVRALRRQQESIYDTGLGSKYTASKEDHYSRIYGKLSLPRFVNNFRPRTVYVGEWE